MTDIQVAETLRRRADAYGKANSGNFLVYGEAEAAQDRAAADAIMAADSLEGASVLLRGCVGGFHSTCGEWLTNHSPASAELAT